MLVDRDWLRAWQGYIDDFGQDRPAACTRGD